jgi:hypothetical protein
LNAYLRSGAHTCVMGHHSGYFIWSFNTLGLTYMNFTFLNSSSSEHPYSGHSFILVPIYPLSQSSFPLYLVALAHTSSLTRICQSAHHSLVLIPSPCMVSALNMKPSLTHTRKDKLFDANLFSLFNAIHEQHQSKCGAWPDHSTDPLQSSRISHTFLHVPIEAFVPADAARRRGGDLHDDIWRGARWWRSHIPLHKHRTRRTTSTSLPSTFLNVFNNPITRIESLHTTGVDEGV